MSKPATGKRKIGRPSIYSFELAKKLCGYLAAGDSLRKACKRPGMPSRDTVRLWLIEHEDFARIHAVALDLQAATWADEIRDSAEGPTSAKADNSVRVQRDRLKLDALKWLLSKLKPKTYGDRLHLDANVARSVEHLSDAELEALAAGAGGARIIEAAQGAKEPEQLH